LILAFGPLLHHLFFKENKPMQSLDVITELPRIGTGNDGLDQILKGGFDPNRMYLYEGRPGSGKTTLALQFLIAGAHDGEPGLYISLSETRRELALVARRHGWTLEGVNIFEINSEGDFDPAEQQSLLYSADLELGETSKRIFDRILEVNPSRIVIDSLSELRLLAQNSLRYRRQILAFKHFFSQRDCTVILLDDLTSNETDLQLHSISHGVIRLEQQNIDYGSQRRRLNVVKMRGIDFSGGFHDFSIRKGGLHIYPRLIAAEHSTPFIGELSKSGNDGLDTMLGGGLERGTSLLLVGSAGVGKSSIAMKIAATAALRGERALFFAFDEGLGTLVARAKGLDLKFDEAFASGKLGIRQIDPAEMSPGEFTAIVRKDVEAEGARVVVIDSLNGYLHAMPDEKFLVLQMHELLTHLGQSGVITILVLAQHGVGGPQDTPVDISYLSDTVCTLRYFEYKGAIRRAFAVVKKRSGGHERSMREFSLSSAGIEFSPSLPEFENMLSGVPRYIGSGSDLLPQS
jgi:circadian clock protein KaiC